MISKFQALNIFIKSILISPPSLEHCYLLILAPPLPMMYLWWFFKIGTFIEKFSSTITLSCFFSISDTCSTSLRGPLRFTLSTSPFLGAGAPPFSLSAFLGAEGNDTWTSGYFTRIFWMFSPFVPIRMGCHFWSMMSSTLASFSILWACSRRSSLALATPSGGPTI